MQITITKIFTKEEQGAKGPYTRMGLKTVEYGDKWLSGFMNRMNANWKEGDKVEVEVEEKFVDNKTYFNFKVLTREQAEIASIKKRLNVLEQFMTKGSVPVVENKVVKEEDLPF